MKVYQFHCDNCEAIIEHRSKDEVSIQEVIDIVLERHYAQGGITNCSLVGSRYLVLDNLIQFHHGMRRG